MFARSRDRQVSPVPVLGDSTHASTDSSRSETETRLSQILPCIWFFSGPRDRSFITSMAFWSQTVPALSLLVSANTPGWFSGPTTTQIYLAAPNMMNASIAKSRRRSPTNIPAYASARLSHSPARAFKWLCQNDRYSQQKVIIKRQEVLLRSTKRHGTPFPVKWHFLCIRYLTLWSRLGKS